MPSLFVSRSDIQQFSVASGDVNPLHTDEKYAAANGYGSTVTHGALTVLHALTALGESTNLPIRRLRARFHHAVHPEQHYDLSVVEQNSNFARIQVSDGGQPVTDVEVELAEIVTADAQAVRLRSGRRRDTAACRSPVEIQPGDRVEVSYLSEPGDFHELLAKSGAARVGVNDNLARLLGWASYVAGMELPGKQSLISSLMVEPDSGVSGDGEVEVVGVDVRRGVIRLASALPGLGRVELTVLAREVPPTLDLSALTSLLPGEEPLTGAVAIVTGGSRGLGAGIAAALACSGASVYLTYQRGEQQAEQLRNALGLVAERVHLVRSDAAVPADCEALRARIMAEQGRLDIVVLNAFPGFQPLRPGPATSQRSDNYVNGAVATVAVPLAAFTDTLGTGGGKVVLVSSSAVTDQPRNWDHYVEAKKRCEQLVRHAVEKRADLGGLVLRPPRLKTAYLPSVAGASGAQTVEPVAVKAVTALATVVIGQTMMLEEPDKGADASARSEGDLVVAATFTTDVLDAPLAGWCRRLGLGLRVSFAPFGQVFQELLAPDSTIGAIRSGCAVVLVRFDDWPANDGERNLLELAGAVRAFADRGTVPLLLRVCPSPSVTGADPRQLRLFDELRDVPGVHLLGVEDWHGGEDPGPVHDEARNRVAHIPYTQSGMTALATGVARAVHALVSPPHKVLVLDCDNTLWQGVAGEDGPTGVRLPLGHHKLQEWAVELRQRGVLIALASKNDPETVAEVFRVRDDMPLRHEHVSAEAIGWESKPEGLARLAEELNLGLDSFVFLDDNPVEVAQVRANLPEVLALTVPEPERIEGFLRRIWAFDRLVVTEEDRGRAATYEANRERGELRRTSLSFKDFLEGLQLQVDLRPAVDSDLRRVAQLTQRTNQFNLTAMRRQEAELRGLLREPGTTCHVVRVSDRFGEYGVSGALVCQQKSDELVVDTFLLSCRVLGRGVEHQVLASLGTNTTTPVRLVYVPTSKNEPARRFLDSLAEGVSGDDGRADYVLTAEQVAAVSFSPATADPDVPAVVSVTTAARAPERVPRQAALVDLAEHLTDVEGIAAWLGTEPRSHSDATTASTALNLLRVVLSDVLGVPEDTLRADTAFAEIAASSLALVEAAVSLEQHFGPLEIEIFYEHRTIGDLAATLTPVAAPTAAPKPRDTEGEVDVLVRNGQIALDVFRGLEQEQVDHIVSKAAMAAAARHLDLAALAVAETERGVVEDKAVKNLFAAEHVTNHMAGLRTVGEIRRDELTGIVEIAEPVGVVCAITPVTNPTSTVVFKALIALKTRNPIIFTFHHLAPGCGAEAAKTVRDAAIAAGAPAHCIQWVAQPSRAATRALMAHEGVSMILATGGNEVVRAAYSSGKPAIGVGAGNVPALIASDADLRRVAHDIVLSKCFDNGMNCAAEQTLLIAAEVWQQTIAEFSERHAHVATEEEKQKLERFLFGPEAHRTGKVPPNPAAVGRSARWIAERAGFHVPAHTSLILAEVDAIGPQEPLTREKPCPVVAVLRYEDKADGQVKAAQVVDFHGSGHTAVVHTADKRIAEDFGKAVKAVRIVWNAPAALGGIGDVYNAFVPSLTLGCGSYGGNSVSDNVSAANLLNIRRIARRNNNIQWFKVPPKIYFEPNSLRYLAEMTGVGRVTIVTGRTVAKLGYVDKVSGVLRGRSSPVAIQVIDFVEPEPSMDTVRRGAEMMREFQPDTIIAVGGGSSLDAGKVMWLCYEHPHVDFDEARTRFSDIRKRVYRLPELGTRAKLVCVPTTSGSGSEVSPFAVITDREAGQKYTLADYALTPSVAIVDSVLVRNLPAGLAADSGFDALTHATEAYVSLYANDFTDGLCLQAIKLIFDNLERSVRHGASDAEAQEKMHNAATIAGMAFSNAFLGIVHAMSHTIGATFGLSHGRTNAVLLPHVIRYNGQPAGKLTGWPKYEHYQAPQRFQHIARVLGLPADTPERGVRSFADAVEDLRSAARLPSSFREAGLNEADFIPALPQQAINAFQDQCAPANPRQPVLSDMEVIMKDAYYGATAPYNAESVTVDHKRNTSESR